MDNASLARPASSSSSRAADPQSLRYDAVILRRKAEVADGPEIQRDLLDIAERFERRAISLEARQNGSL
jgi:hypothetical protein